MAILYNGTLKFHPGEWNLLLALGAVLSQLIQRAMLYDREHVMSMALQQAMLPSCIPRVRGLDIAVRYQPTATGQQAGGDWYDAIPGRDGKVLLVIGDIQGHDVQATAVMGQLRSAWRAYPGEGHRPAAIMVKASLFHRGGVGVFRSESVVHGHHDRAQSAGHGRCAGLLGVQVTGDEAAAVDVQDRRQPSGGMGGPVHPDGDRMPLRGGQEAVVDQEAVERGGGELRDGNELEGADLVERVRSPEDRRRHVVRLTAAGTDRLTLAETALSSAEDAVLGALTPEQRETPHGLLQLAAIEDPASCAAAAAEEPTPPLPRPLA